MWIGATCGGLIRFKDGVAKTYTKRDGLPNDCIWSLAEDRDGSLWVGTFGNGLFRFAGDRFTPFTENNKLPGQIVFSLFQDTTGTLWIGTDGGLGRFKDANLTTYTVQQGVVSNSVRFIMEDPSGAIWLGTTGGISRFKDGKFTNYTTRDGLSYDSVRAIYEDHDGVLWIGTYCGGLNRLRDGKFTSYTTKAGLSDNTVSRIIEDDRGNLWMNGNNGISRVSKQELNDYADGTRKSVSAIRYGVADGMPSREGTGGGQPAGWRTRDGKMWFPTIAGVVAINPDAPSESPPPVFIERVIVNGNPVDLSGTPDIPPGASQIEFHYTAPSFQNPSRVRFKYRLDGYDNDWVEAGSRRTAYYTNLPPGRYRFVVTASNSEGVWNDWGAEVDFHLRPHFYQTFLFYSLSS
ncbi:MAG: ligand-binding sensor domain-containing protein, partial [Blastocatellia bacterium]